jgi:integrase
VQLLTDLTAYHGALFGSGKKSEWIFVNPDTGKPYVQMHYSWDTARKQAGLDGFRMHDLRHTFASFLINADRSLYEVQKILGHTQIKTTQRYSHLSQDLAGGGRHGRRSLGGTRSLRQLTGLPPMQPPRDGDGPARLTCNQ